MARLQKIVTLMAFGALGVLGGNRSACQEAFPGSLLRPAKETELGSLKICLRLPDESAFAGAALVRVAPERGEELLGGPGDVKGEFLFFAVSAGKYIVDVSAPGYLAARTSVQMEAGGAEKQVFVVLKPRTAKAEEEPTAKAQAEEMQETGGTTEEWEGGRPHELEDTVPPVDASVACPTKDVLQGVGQRMKEFVNSLEKFTATEKVEHYTFGKSGARKEPERRSFAYVVTLTQDRFGGFVLEEYRNGSQDRTLFPANIATIGLPTIGLIFHPLIASDFDFRCEGLGRWEGREMWQVHFAQRQDRPVRIEAYEVDRTSFPVHLEGRAWIDPGSLQLAGLESELQKPIPEIKLTQQRQKIRYGPVQFASTGEEIWLPKEAGTYVDRKGRRFYRRHTFSEFRLFNVDTTQKWQPPKGSYSFTNVTDRDVPCELTVVPVEGLKGAPVTLRFTIPAHGKVFKVVGPGKDVNLPLAAVGSARFLYSGEEGSVKVDVDLAKETTLDVMAEP